MARIPTVVDGRLEGASAARLDVGSPDWFAWLAAEHARSFSFRSPAGGFTARKERRQRGGAYWVAYRTAAGRQHKVYLGKGEELTADRLTAAAARLADRAGPGTPAGAALPLLATKLFVPRPRPGLVPRPRLTARLDAALTTARCSLVCAPAGAGKTSLLAAWLARLDRPVAWLTLDDRDRDPAQVLRYLIGALRSIDPACGRGALAWLDEPRSPPVEAIVTGLVNDLAALPAPGVLVLDDYHLVREPAVHRAVTFLLDHLPPPVHLVIAAREDPPLPLPRLRARNELAEVRTADLGFTVAEAAAFLGDGMRLPLEPGQVAALVERTEGWAAGLQLAGLALRDRPDPGAFVTAFAGGNRLVADYLTAEVLDREPEPTRRFLTATAVLDRFCAPLCDDLLGGDSREMLSEVERANLFLVPLDDDRVWYRYHHLFADALRARLARDDAAALHRTAAAWFGRAGLLPEAIGHALAGDAPRAAADWIEELAPTLFASMSVHGTLADWLAALPEPLVRARPRLGLAQAWLLIHQVRLGPATAWVDAAERATGDDPAARGAVAATRAYLATVTPQSAPRQAASWAEAALRDLLPDDAAYRGVAGLSLGQASLALGRLDRAERVLGDVAAAERAAGLVQGYLTAATQQVNVQRLRGARRRALATGRAALEWAGEHAVAATAGRLRTVLADLLIDANDLAAALPLALDGMAAPREFGSAPPLVLLGALPLIRLHLAAGDPEAADAVLTEVRPLVQHASFAMVTRLLEAAEARVRLARGDGAAALAWAAEAAWTGPVEAADMLRFGVAGVEAADMLRFGVAGVEAADMLRFGVAGVEAAAVTPVRVLIAGGRLPAAERHLAVAGAVAERCGLGWLRLRLLILRARLADASGDRGAALETLAAAVALAAPDGVLRPFLDEGDPMASLLDGLGEPAFARRLLAAFPRGAGGLIEPLTGRELDVLRLLAAGRSTAELAAALFVEPSTVKTHLIHVYRKLGVHNRVQAVARARALALLD